MASKATLSTPKTVRRRGWARGSSRYPLPVELPRAPVSGLHLGAPPTAALTAALLGFFVITLDAVVVNVVLPSISRDLGGGVTGLQFEAASLEVVYEFFAGERRGVVT
jgi:hypothetical protein